MIEKKILVNTFITVCLLCIGCMAISQTGEEGISLIHHKDKHVLEIRVDGKLFSNYMYAPSLEKPLLFPIYTRSGIRVTRGYPLLPIEGERSDHPHHLGLWFNYGDVNGLDFWNNSARVTEERKHRYGHIRHQEFRQTKNGIDVGSFTVVSHWLDHQEHILLEEETTFEISRQENHLIIDRTATLKAAEDVLFKDNKEGMLGIRVIRALELPNDGQVLLTDANGKPKDEKEPDTANVQGDYLSSSGITGGKVWGTRAEWMRLSGIHDGTPISITMIDHPNNPGYPTHWHARGYGLFAANTLGQHAFDKSKQFDFSLKKDETATFTYRVIISDDEIADPDFIKRLQADFISN